MPVPAATGDFLHTLKRIASALERIALALEVYGARK